MATIDKNKIIYPDHVIVFDEALVSKFKEEEFPGYMEDMVSWLTPDGSAEDHEQELDDMNNDGSWTVVKTGAV